jgi:type II secretory pathway pseudopilin PulG
MSRRRGLSILELTVAMIILGTLMGLCLKWVAATGGQQREAQWRALAVREAANTMERLAAQSWEDLSADRAAKLALSEEARQSLPEGDLAVQVTPAAGAAGDPESKEIAVTVRWRPRPETPEARVRLVAWKFRKSK